VTQDNLASHIGIELIRFCKDKSLELVCFPAKTTHVLQPVDAVVHHLKLKFTQIARRAQLAKPNGVINKSTFSGIQVIADLFSAFVIISLCVVI
jgi:hypothetical protein